MNISIEYENSDFLVVNKPAGLPVYSTKRHEAEDSVLSWALQKYPAIKNVGPLRSSEDEARDPERPGIVHRLDKQTSGLLVLAKTSAGFAFLSHLFRSRQITKEYLALVYGQTPKHGIIEKPLTKIGQEGRSKVRVDEKGKEAKTEYWAVEYYLLPHPNPLLSKEREKGEVEGLDQFTFLRVKLHTGRTHQIRVHFSSEKHPVMGDDLYGKPNSQKLSSILGRQFLHATRLEFKLPDGTWLEIESDLPPELKKVLEILSTKHEIRNNA